MSELKGLIKIRKLSVNSLGITLPKELIKHLQLDVGTYVYTAKKEKDVFVLNFSILQKGKGV